MNIQKIYDKAISSDVVPELILNYKRSTISKKRLDTTEKRVDFLLQIFDPNTFDTKEEMVLLILDDLDHPVCFYRLGKGTGDSVEVMHKDLLAILITNHTSKFIIAHNHPDHNPLPSYGDIEFVHNIRMRTIMFGIEFEDSIIISRLDPEAEEGEEEYDVPHYFSLADNNLLFA
ncbi:JAB domain-containing protein [Lewinella sp. LCG006]|uniref:JAB domain-containing protein n=1 Tax=Lewinella sp. LCG006 TaxID=3231911 RepID=UPI0034609D5D